ncbi:M57 family metalloprotease [Nocardioides marmoriginsengisoli]|nr:M57 family metalloprotease [Nocardioides marmoriginsengisoli]
MTSTNVTTDELGTCTTSVDVRVQQRDTGGSLGDTWCARSWANGRCDRFRVRVDTGTIAAYATNVNFEIRHTICHEIGHTVGLWHYGHGDPYTVSADSGGGNNCMRSGVWDSGASWTRVYGVHDIAAINSNW